MSVSFYLGNLKDGATTIDFVKDLDVDMYSVGFAYRF